MPQETPSAPEPQPSIMQYLEKKAGRQARVALREVDSVPVLRPVEGQTRSGKYQLQGEIARGGVLRTGPRAGRREPMGPTERR